MRRRPAAEVSQDLRHGNVLDYLAGDSLDRHLLANACISFEVVD